MLVKRWGASQLCSYPTGSDFPNPIVFRSSCFMEGTNQNHSKQRERERKENRDRERAKERNEMGAWSSVLKIAYLPSSPRVLSLSK